MLTIRASTGIDQSSAVYGDPVARTRAIGDVGVPMIKSSQEFAAGTMFVTVGVGGLWFGRNLKIGSASFMEAGYLPTLLSWVLIGIGAVVLIRSLVTSGPKLTTWAWRPLLLLTVTVFAFGLLINNAGLVLTTVAVTLLANYAGQPLKPLPLAILIGVMVAMMVAVFYFGLRLPIPVWPL